MSGSFAASTVYTANIQLTAKAGWTLTGLAANSFTVAGANSVSHAANSGSVTAVFPATLFLLNMVYVPAGSFQRDATETNISVVNDFQISTYETTRTQWRAIFGDNYDPTYEIYSTGLNNPAQQVSWYAALAYCNKLSLAEGLTPVYSVSVNGTPVNWSSLSYSQIPITNNLDWNAATANWGNNGFRLPTEMEWMWAAMGAPADGQNGGTNRTGYAKPFAGSDGNNHIANYSVYGYYDFIKNDGQTTEHTTQAVGSKTGGANELGLYDMSGNVFEWCWDYHAYYQTTQQLSVFGTIVDYRGPDTGGYHVMRGGSWVAPARCSAVMYRGQNDPSVLSAYTGFRIVRR